MPGIFGHLGSYEGEFDALRQEFSKPWEEADFFSFRWGCLGGHAFGTGSALHVSGKHFYFAINGEALSYSLLAKKVNEIDSLKSDKEILDLAAVCKGSIAIIDVRMRVCHLATEHTGTFPLYYAQKNGVLLFSSKLKSLARVLDSSPDHVGIFEFLHRRYTFNGRTHFQNISRILPGQVISYYLDSKRLLVQEPKIAWICKKTLNSEKKITPDLLWDTLSTAVKGSFDNEKRHALMMSGGWDSRLLLCAMLSQLNSKKVLAYSFGDLNSRELKLVNQICHLVGVECLQEPLDEGLYEPSFLQKIFERVECVIFPQWHRAAERLAGIDVKSVSAGVYGEVLGGHYGPGMLFNGVRKVTTVGRGLIGLPVQFNVFELLRFPKLTEKPRFLAEAFGIALNDVTQEINVDIESSLHHLVRQGLEDSEQLLEAFIALNRGSKYINQQLLSCRTILDVTLPFLDLNFLKLSRQIPLKTKIHNSIHREILLQYGPALLQFPTSAILVPAAWPILIQETTRALRKLHDEVHRKLNSALSGHIGPSHTNNLGLEFLRNGNALRKLLDDLRCDMWDRNALACSISKAADFKEDNLLSLSYNFLTIYTTDLMLR